MIKLTHEELQLPDDELLEIQIRSVSSNTIPERRVQLTATDLKKLILILNLSIGNLPDDAPDVTDFVKSLTKGIGFRNPETPL